MALVGMRRPAHTEAMLDAVLDVFRMRQYFDVLTRTRELAGGVLDDIGLLDDARRAIVRLPTDRREVPGPAFPPPRQFATGIERLERLALVATGGSGALASVVGAARALEEAGIRPSVISLCSGSALFGFPIAAGLPAADVADFVAGAPAGGLSRRRLVQAGPPPAHDGTWFRRHPPRRSGRARLPPPPRRHDPGRPPDPRLRADLEHRGEPGRVPRDPRPTRAVGGPGRPSGGGVAAVHRPRRAGRRITGATAASSTSSRCIRCSTSRRRAR